MLKFNAFWEEKNWYSLDKNKPKSIWVSNNSILTEEIFVSLLIYTIYEGSK